MKSRWTMIAVSCLIILTIVAALSLSCGKGGTTKGKVTITIGNISDMTGPASTALIPINYALEDAAKYYNDDNLIPGVTIKVVTYDARYDPSLDIPGWDWIKSKGAVLGFTSLPTTAETLKPFAETDKMPIWALAPTEALESPPGWVFLSDCLTQDLIDPLLKWISENDPNFPTDRPARIGSAGWEEPYASSCLAAIKAYSQAHPDKWEWVNGYLTPMGSTEWRGQVEGLKNCDYVWPPSTGTGVSTFMQQLQESGWKGTFLSSDSQTAYENLIIGTLGWAGVDGMLCVLPLRWWTETQSPTVALARQVLQANHPDKFNDFVDSGVGYIGGFQQCLALLDIVKAAVEDVGAANFNGQAFYNTAINFSDQWPTYEQWNFTATKRTAWNYVGIYKWEASAQNLVRIDSSWVPITAD